MKIIRTLTAALAAGIMSLTTMACTSSNVPSVPAPTFSKEISGGNVQLLDVRTPEEYSDGHIKDALNIDYYSPDFLSDATKVLKKETPVYIYCRSGRRSLSAAEKLLADGFSVVNLDGGIIAWQQASLPIVK